MVDQSESEDNSIGVDSAIGSTTPDQNLSDDRVAGGVEEVAEERLAKSRERNREHARRTRLRKKAQLQALQTKIKDLYDEGQLLRQTVEECSIASILLDLSSGNDKVVDSLDDFDLKSAVANSPNTTVLIGKRKRFLSDASDRVPMKLNIKGEDTLVGGNGKTHINWKSGVYLDESGVQKQLSPEELEDLRRERNRMHAKMTRDRKKVFVSSVEETIAELELENLRLRDLLAKQAQIHVIAKPCNPASSPSIVFSISKLLSSESYAKPTQISPEKTVALTCVSQSESPAKPHEFIPSHQLTTSQGFTVIA